MRARAFLMLLMGGLGAAGAGAAACSSSDTPEDPTEAGAETSTPPKEAGQDQTSPPPTDAATAKESGNCTKVKGPCDLVLQDCQPGQECVVTRPAGGSFTTTCRAVGASQQLPIGRACCPGATNPCLPGLTCVGDDCVDGSAPTARCAPACCPGDDTSCGKSDPEGIAGACDITLFSNSEELHNTCTYKERCKPLRLEPCKPGQACIVEDKVGTSSCVSSNGLPEGAPCGFLNDCADGMMCFGPADGGAKCRLLCLTPNAATPFDAGALEGGPGRGGCPAGETCNIGLSPQQFPAWLSICRFTDGG